MSETITELKLHSKSILAALDIRIAYKKLNVHGEGRLRIGPISSDIFANLVRKEDGELESYILEAKTFSFFEKYHRKEDGQLWHSSSKSAQEKKVAGSEQNFLDPLSLIFQVYSESQSGLYSETYNILSGNKIQKLVQKDGTLLKDGNPVVLLMRNGFKNLKPKIAVTVTKV